VVKCTKGLAEGRPQAYTRDALRPPPEHASDESTGTHVRAHPAVPQFSDFIVFVDESGDHGMSSIDPSYPVFTLAFCLFAKEAYATRVAPAVLDFKFRHFGHDQVILHEHEIRKTKGAFRFLTDTGRREPCFADLNALVECAPFTLVASVIDKRLYKERYPEAANPYHVAMGFGLERIYLHLRDLGCRAGVTHLLFERRGEKEDRALEEEFRRVCAGQNGMLARLPFEIVMADKRCNSAGLQLADLVARPIGRKVLDPGQPNRAFDILAGKLRRNRHGRVEGWGLKVFP
jgi:hypothetical protein